MRTPFVPRFLDAFGGGAEGVAGWTGVSAVDAGTVVDGEVGGGCRGGEDEGAGHCCNLGAGRSVIGVGSTSAEEE